MKARARALLSSIAPPPAIILLILAIAASGAAAFARQQPFDSPVPASAATPAAIDPAAPLSAMPPQTPAAVAGPALLGQPVYGPAPLTVYFYVTFAGPPPPLSYQWSFGDGSVSSLPPAAFMPHVYSHPGNYICSLTLTSHQGQSTTLFTTVIVRPLSG
jgi:hypothetical protein